ncbi:putative MT-associated protein TORTIFOLIA1/SPIRAL2 [Heracleum sosnowskyi]|uniref:MT-associated protein TORTIFOLIA1/SPIRAL2 n=1 Tax=Heracleum sosnowskyi TaxID=360622 RepID=A0AAD8ML48_9APIA|nr:putative MT-associated protein TORTIFOLIA1/SPIRAL2 [Heracleum sosnowskyi]
MSLNKRHSTSSQPQSDLKHRVITCINKLSDRDTLAVATTELESIAKSLSHDSFYPFLNCLSTTDSSEKSPVRKQCVRLLGLLSTSHGDNLSPHLSKMLAAVVRRLRDSDSAVRLACVAAVTSMASQITKPPFSILSKPLIEAILHEQDLNLQTGSALCLAAAIEAAPDPEPVQLQKLLPKLLKLSKSDGFKAKSAILSLIGSVVSAGAAKSSNVIKCLIQCLIEFLRSEDWAVRKAAAEALLKLATTEKCSLIEYKSSCLAALESRRFDKVKVVRDTMNQACELWKAIADEEDLSSPQLSTGNRSDSNSSPVSEGPRQIGIETNKATKTIPRSRLPPSDGTLTRIASRTSQSKPKLLFKKPFDRKTEIAEAQPKVVSEDESGIIKSKFQGSMDDGHFRMVKQEAKRVLFSKSHDEKSHKVGGLRSTSRVVPFIEDETFELNEVDEIAYEDSYINHKEAENLSLIQEQLLHIENQQSSLFALLQRYIGSSQSGMNSLETRVNGLEMALDEISQNVAVSSGNVSDTDSSGNNCCMLPRAEFLSPKFWKKTEGQYSSSRVSFSGRKQLAYVVSGLPNKDGDAEKVKPENPKMGLMGAQLKILHGVKTKVLKQSPELLFSSVLILCDGLDLSRLGSAYKGVNDSNKYEKIHDGVSLSMASTPPA